MFTTKAEKITLTVGEAVYTVPVNLSKKELREWLIAHGLSVAKLDELWVAYCKAMEKVNHYKKAMSRFNTAVAETGVSPTGNGPTGPRGPGE